MIDDVAQRLARLEAGATRFASSSRAPATERAYAHDWADFRLWCAAHRLPTLPAAPRTVALFLTERAGHLKVATLQRRLWAIVAYHRRASVPFDPHHPQLTEVWRGIRRTLGARREPKAALTPDALRQVLACLPTTPHGLRDRALILLGYAGAMRRSELVGLDVSDLAFTSEGLIVTLRRGKSDQEGVGGKRGVPLGQAPETCPVSAVRNWLMAAGLTDGPLFRRVDAHGRIGALRLSDKAVALVVKAAVAKAARANGLTARAAQAQADSVAAHSLRAGLATAAAAAGAAEWEIMGQTGHRSQATMREYIRLGSLFSANPARRIL